MCTSTSKHHKKLVHNNERTKNKVTTKYELVEFSVFQETSRTNHSNFHKEYTF